MLEMHNDNLQKKEYQNKNEFFRKRRSKWWLLLSLTIFIIFIFLILYILLRARFIYLPILSEQFGGKVAPEYRLSIDNIENDDLIWSNWSQENEFTILTFSENQASKLLQKYFDPKWQIIFKEGGFEFFGSLYSAINNHDYWSEVKILFIEGQLFINLNGMNISERLNNYLLNYMISEDRSSKKSFEKIVFSVGKLSVYFSKDQVGVLLKDFNIENFFKNLIQYLFYQN